MSGYQILGAVPISSCGLLGSCYTCQFYVICRPHLTSAVGLTPDCPSKYRVLVLEFVIKPTTLLSSLSRLYPSPAPAYFGISVKFTSGRWSHWLWYASTEWTDADGGEGRWVSHMCFGLTRRSPSILLSQFYRFPWNASFFDPSWENACFL